MKLSDIINYFILFTVLCVIWFFTGTILAKLFVEWLLQ